MLLELIISSLVAYLIGSIPIAYLLGRIKGVNVFAQGSKRAGTANIWTLVSPAYGIAVLLLDVAKGFAAILFAQWVGLSNYFIFIPALFGIIGHWNSPFTRMKGGEGAATLVGVSLGLYGIVAFPGYLLSTMTYMAMTKYLRTPHLSGGIVTFLVVTAVAVLAIAYSRESYAPLVGLASLPRPWGPLFTAPTVSAVIVVTSLSIIVVSRTYLRYKLNYRREISNTT